MTTELNAEERRAAALAQARELQTVLEQLIKLPEYSEEGSCPAFALDYVEQAIAYLKPSPPGEDEDDEEGAWRYGKKRGVEYVAIDGKLICLNLRRRVPDPAPPQAPSPPPGPQRRKRRP